MQRSGNRPRVLLAGEAQGLVLRLAESLSFWGGVEPETGTIIDRRHPQHGRSVTGRVLVMPGGRGSSSSSTVLAEAIRLGTGPAAIVLTEPDPIIVLGAVVAQELYGIAIPILLVEEEPDLRTGDSVAIAGDRINPILSGRQMNTLSTTSAAVLGLALAFAFFFAVWLASLAQRDASLVDRFWGAGFVVLAAFYTMTTPAVGNGARFTALALTALWGFRLSIYLTRRNWGHGEDYRYAEMRERHGRRFPAVSLFTVFLVQAVLLWLIAFPLLLTGRATEPPNAALLLTGILIWLAGFLIEIVADAQLTRHRKDPTRSGPLDRGLWRYSRHPNYFGEAVLWWGMWLVATSFGGGWTIFSPILMNFLLVRVSGVAMLEKRLRSVKPGWEDYAARTSAFVPWPPRSGDDRNR